MGDSTDDTADDTEPRGQTLRSGLHAAHFPAGSLPDGSDEQKPFRQGGPDPTEVGGEGSRPDTGQSAPRGAARAAWPAEEDAAHRAGVSGSRCCRTSCTPETRDTTPTARGSSFPPEPSDHYLKLEEKIMHLLKRLSSCCVFYLIFQRTPSFIIQNRESKLRRNGFLSIRLSVALSNCL